MGWNVAMCTVCGCNERESDSHSHAPRGAERSENGHNHDHDNSHGHGHHHYGQDLAGVSVGGFSQPRLLEIEQNILSKNDRYADANRRRLAEHGTLALNLVSSPGAGKTTLLVEFLKRLKGQIPLGVIEGDQETANDADKIRETGVPVVQINTGKGCHLDAHMIGHAMEEFSLDPGGIIFIENVGNLVCPAAFDLGEAAKVVILSTTEGEDKPVKYPDMFAASDLMILSKIDLLPHLDFDADAAVKYAHTVNPDLEVIEISAKTGEGLQAWQEWMFAKVKDTAGGMHGALSREESVADSDLSIRS